MKKKHFLSALSLSLSVFMFSCTGNNILTESESLTALSSAGQGAYEFDLAKSKNSVKTGAKITVKITGSGFVTKASGLGSAPGAPKKTFSDVTKLSVNLCTDPTRPLTTSVFTPVEINFSGNDPGPNQQTLTYLNVPPGTYYATVQAFDASAENITEKNNNGEVYASPDEDTQIAVSTTAVSIDSNLTVTPAGSLSVAVNLLNAVGATIDTNINLNDGTGGLLNNNSSAEFMVNQYQASGQINPAVASYDGGFAVVWESMGQDGDQSGIFARVFDKFGKPLTEEFQVNTTTAGYQGNPDIAMDSAGNFVIVWEGDRPSTARDIFRRLYNASGVPLTNETLTIADSDNQTNPAVARNSNGEFAITWDSVDSGLKKVHAQVFQASGTAFTADFYVIGATNNQSNPDIGIDSSNRITVVWEEENINGDPLGIAARGWANNGGGYFSQFQVNTITAGNQMNPSVAVGDSGDFIVSWDSQNLDGNSEGVAVRSFLAGGSPNEGSDVQVNTFIPGSQIFPKVAVNKGFTEEVLTWQSFQDLAGTNFGIYFIKKYFSPLMISDELQANITVADEQSKPDAAINNKGEYVIVWESADADSKGIFARRFKGNTGL